MRLAIFGTVLASTFASAAMAAPVPDGTVSAVANFNPTLVLSGGSGTYSAVNGATSEISGTGGFSPLAQTTGTLNGTVLFSSTVGTIVNEALPNFYVFSDAKGGTYNFSLSSVQTTAFVNTPGLVTNGTLYLLGSLIDSNLNFLTPTPASLSVQFNSTGGSAFSSALTLSVPPAGQGAVPEPATWAMMMLGVGMIGGVARRRKSVTTRVLFS